VIALLTLSLLAADYCARATDALDWKPGLVCPPGTWVTAFLMRHKSGAHLACVDKETRKRRGPYIAIDCAGTVMARGTMVNEQPGFMAQPDHCKEAQDETSERVACPEGTAYNRVVLDDGVVHQCLRTDTRQPDGPYVERTCAGEARKRGVMHDGVLALAEPERTTAPLPPPANVPEAAASQPAPAYAVLAPSARRAHVQLAFNVMLGAAVGVAKDAAALAREGRVGTATFTLGYRQEIFISPPTGRVDLGFYAEALTQKSFTDVLLGGGIALRVIHRMVSIVPSIGADARWDKQSWGTSVSGGLFVGAHGDSGLTALPAGFRVELKQRLTPDHETALFFLVQFDVIWPFYLPLMLIGASKPWFPHG
jgi:hypothetical protein